MATLYIAEFNSLGGSGGFPAQIVSAPAVTTQVVTISGTSGQSAAFNKNTTIVRIHTDAICSVLFGSNPTATTAHPRMAADNTEYFAVNPGDKIAVISNT